MITKRHQSIAQRRPTPTTPILPRLFAVLGWPFTHRYAAPLWLALRLYVGWIWIQMGLTKLQAGWLTSDPIGNLLRHVANGTIPLWNQH
jgi:hypothetical protein